MRNYKLLDCTLRDGGHVVDGVFGNAVIKSIIKDLVKAKVDIIEVGFLWPVETNKDTARFLSIKELKKFLPNDMGNSKITLMADNIDLSEIEPNDGSVEFIRLSFRKTEFEWAKRTADILRSKSYKCFINVIHASSFSDDELLNIIQCVNQIKPYGFSIVDTFGALRRRDLDRIYQIIEHNLEPNIVLGLHLHENLGLSYSLAQHMLNIVSPTRELILDGSLYGMGKVPGNLCIEQIMDYMNNEYGSNYALEPVYDAIDDYIMPLYKKYGWGYLIPYAISAQYGVHRTYAEYLSGIDRLHTKDMKRLLNMIDESHKETFDKAFIERLYNQYMLADYDDTMSYSNLKEKLNKAKGVVLIAPGASIKNFVFNHKLLNNHCVITINFVLESIKEDYCFFTNPKRLVYSNGIGKTQMIITSNLREDVDGECYIFSRNDLSYHDDIYCDDSTLMALNLIKKCGIRKVYLAGFDGFKKGENNFYDNQFERQLREADYDKALRIQILNSSYNMLNIEYLTPSIYQTR